MSVSEELEERLDLQAGGEVSYVMTSESDYVFVKYSFNSSDKDPVLLVELRARNGKSAHYQETCSVAIDEDYDYGYEYDYGEYVPARAICTIHASNISFDTISLQNNGDVSLSIIAVGVSQKENHNEKIFKMRSDGESRLGDVADYSNKSVSFITVLGKRGTGKSTIASLLSGNPRLFVTGTRSIGTTTEGIHVSPMYHSNAHALQMQDKLSSTFSQSYSSSSQLMYFLDTEGMGIYGREQDLVMLVPFAILSKTLIWVSSDTVHTARELEQLEIFVDAVARIHNPEDGSKFAFDRLIYVLNKMQASETDDDIYKTLLGKEKAGHGSGKRNQKRAKIRNAFREINVVGLPFLQLSPFPDILQYEHLSSEHNARFKYGLAKITSYILESSARNKSIGSLDITGRTLTQALVQTIELSNSGQVFISDLTQRTSITLTISQISKDLITKISTSLVNIDTFPGKCIEACAQFTNAMTELNSTVPDFGPLSYFFEKSYSDLITESSTQLHPIFNKYIKELKLKLTFPTESDCTTLPLSTMGCYLENIKEARAQNLTRLVSATNQTFPELHLYLQEEKLKALTYPVSLVSCARARQAELERVRNCSNNAYVASLEIAADLDLDRDNEIEIAYWNIDSYFNNCHLKSVSHKLTQSLLNLCVINVYVYDQIMQSIKHHLKSYESTYNYNEYVASILANRNHNSMTHFSKEVVHDGRKEVKIYKPFCDLSTMLVDSRLRNKNVQVFCWKAGFFGSETVLNSRVKSLQIVTPLLSLSKSIFLEFTNERDDDSLFVLETSEIEGNGFLSITSRESNEVSNNRAVDQNDEDSDNVFRTNYDLTLFYSLCDLSSLVTNITWRGKSVKLTCREARFSGNSHITSKAKVLQIVTNQLDIRTKTVLEFEKPETPVTLPTPATNLVSNGGNAQDGAHGQNGGNGGSFLLRASRVLGDKTLRVVANGGDGGKGGNGQNGAAGINGTDGADAVQKDASELDFEVSCYEGYTCECLVNCQKRGGFWRTALEVITIGLYSATDDFCCLRKLKFSLSEYFEGTKGLIGTEGEKGGNGGNGGKGGNTGIVIFDVPANVMRRFKYMSIPGEAGEAGKEGKGAVNGKKGIDGDSYRCTYNIDIIHGKDRTNLYNTDISHKSVKCDTLQKSTPRITYKPSGVKGNAGDPGIHSSGEIDLPRDGIVFNNNVSSNVYFRMVSQARTVQQLHANWSTNSIVYYEGQDYIYSPRDTKEFSTIITNAFEPLRVIEDEFNKVSAENINTDNTLSALNDASNELSNEIGYLDTERSACVSTIQDLRRSMNLMLDDLQFVSDEVITQITNKLIAEHQELLEENEEQRHQIQVQAEQQAINTATGLVNTVLSLVTLNPMGYVSSVNQWANGISSLINLYELEAQLDREEFEAEIEMLREIEDSGNVVENMNSILTASGWIRGVSDASNQVLPESFHDLNSNVLLSFGATLEYGQLIQDSGSVYIDVKLAKLKLEQLMMDTQITLLDLLPVYAARAYRLKLEHLFDYARTSLDLMLRENVLQQNIRKLEMDKEDIEAEIHRLNYLLANQQHHLIHTWSRLGLIYTTEKKRIVEKMLSLRAMLSYIKNEPWEVPQKFNALESVDTLFANFRQIKNEFIQLKSSTPHTVSKNIWLDILEYPDLFELLQGSSYSGVFSISHYFDVEHQYWVENAKVVLLNVSSNNQKIFTRLTHPGYSLNTKPGSPLGGLNLPATSFESLYKYETPVNTQVDWFIEPRPYYTEHDWVKLNVHTMWTLEVEPGKGVAGHRANYDLDLSGCQRILLQLELSYYA